MLFEWEEELVGERCVLLNNVVLQDDVEDKWRCYLKPVKDYTVNGGLSFVVLSGVD